MPMLLCRAHDEITFENTVSVFTVFSKTGHRMRLEISQMVVTVSFFLILDMNPLFFARYQLYIVPLRYASYTLVAYQNRNLRRFTSDLQGTCIKILIVET